MKTILIGGKDYPIKYGRKALQFVLTLAGAKSLKEAAKIDALELDKWGKFVHAGIVTGCKIQDIEPPELEDVEEALDDDLSIWAQATAAFSDDITGEKKANTEGN